MILSGEGCAIKTLNGLYSVQIRLYKVHRPPYIETA